MIQLLILFSLKVFTFTSPQGFSHYVKALFLLSDHSLDVDVLLQPVLGTPSSSALPLISDPVESSNLHALMYTYLPVSVEPDPPREEPVRPRGGYGDRQVPLRPHGQQHSRLGREGKPRQHPGSVLRNQRGIHQG